MRVKLAENGVEEEAKMYAMISLGLLQDYYSFLFGVFCAVLCIAEPLVLLRGAYYYFLLCRYFAALYVTDAISTGNRCLTKL